MTLVHFERVARPFCNLAEQRPGPIEAPYPADAHWPSKDAGPNVRSSSHLVCLSRVNVKTVKPSPSPRAARDVALTLVVFAKRPGGQTQFSAALSAQFASGDVNARSSGRGKDEELSDSRQEQDEFVVLRQSV